MTSERSTARARRVIGVRQGASPGPVVVCVAGVHGNELAGVRAAERVLARLAEAPAGAVRGRLVALAGNLAAMDDPDPHRRSIDRDLNRMFTEALIEGARQTPPEDRYAEQRETLGLLEAIEAELATAEGPAIVLDMHTVSSPSPAFLGVEDSLAARRVAAHFEVPMVLGFEEELSGLLVDYVTTRHGVVSILLEAGLHDDPGSIDVHEAAIWVALETAGLVDLGAFGLERDPREVLRRAAGRRVGHVYDVRHCEPIMHPSFEVDPSLHSFDRVRRGQRVATEGGRPIESPMTGLLFMPNRQRDKRVGDDGFFVTLRVGRGWLWLSSQLRRSESVHALLPLVAPGVRRCRTRPGTLLVDPHVAPVFKRELFHLLGYRLLRHGEDVHLPAWRRVVRGATGVAHSAWMMLSGALRGGERAVLARETPEDWIVGRRRLDLDPPEGL
jgi:succinylglutamate desuccinylase